jgi:hypothetical protein
LAQRPRNLATNKGGLTRRTKNSATKKEATVVTHPKENHNNIEYIDEGRIKANKRRY